MKPDIWIISDDYSDDISQIICKFLDHVLLILLEIYSCNLGALYMMEFWKKIKNSISPQTLTGQYILSISIFIAINITVYFIFVYLVTTFIGPLSVIDIISIVKLISLVNVIMINGHIIATPDSGVILIKSINSLIILFCVILVLGIVIKFVGFVVKEEGSNGDVVSFYKNFQNNIYWLSAIPVFMYFALDLLIFFMSPAGKKSRLIAARYIVVSDIPCVIPLATLVVSVVLFRDQLFDNSGADVEIFLGGSVTIIILTSAILTKTVDFYQEYHDGGYS